MNYYRLIPITFENLQMYHNFEKKYDNNLSNFQSRIFPNNYLQNIGTNLLIWYYIFCENLNIGSIWLEKKEEVDTSAVLGIFIADEEFRGKGIGKNVITHFINNNIKHLGINSISLNVRLDNIRAIQCYESCGFKKIDEFVKSNGIKVIKMLFISDPVD